MSRPALPILALAILGLASCLRAEQVLVTGVSGLVLYGPKAMMPMLAVHAGQKWDPGTFSCAHDAILYLSAFDGSELRLSESGTLRYDGSDNLCHMEGGSNQRSNFHLIRGKVEVNIKFPATPPHCYHVILPQAETSMSHGQCVMCMHGGGTFLFVSHGDLAVTPEKKYEPLPKSGAPPPVDSTAPTYGALPAPQERTLTPIQADRSQLLVGNGQVGVIGVNGNIQVQPLSSLTAATQSCLLAAFNPGVVEGGSSKKAATPDSNPNPPPPTNRPPVSFRRFNTIVSPTQ